MILNDTYIIGGLCNTEYEKCVINYSTSISNSKKQNIQKQQHFRK